MNDPVLQRSMFRGPQPTVDPGAPAGIRSMTTPDENAQALRNMFRTPVAMVQPVQSFQTGGLAEPLRIEVPDIVPPVSEAPVALPAAAPARAASTSSEEPIPERPIASGIRSLFNYMFPPRAAPAAPARTPAAPAVPALPAPVEVGAAPGMNYPSEPPPSAAASAPRPREKGALELTLEGIRAERAKSAEDRRQNALLALMQAGFAAAAGTSPNALTNIGAGGQAGIASFANLEKARREEQSALRRDELQLQLAQAQMKAQEERAPEQIRTLAMLGGWTPDQGREGLNAAVTRGIQVQRSMQQDPEMIRTFQILGGGDVRRGFDIYNADRRLQAAIAVTKDITASEEDKRAANEYIRGQLAQGRAATGAFPGFTATPVR